MAHFALQVEDKKYLLHIIFGKANVAVNEKTERVKS